MREEGISFWGERRRTLCRLRQGRIRGAEGGAGEEAEGSEGDGGARKRKGAGSLGTEACGKAAAAGPVLGREERKRAGKLHRDRGCWRKDNGDTDNKHPESGTQQPHSRVWVYDNCRRRIGNREPHHQIKTGSELFKRYLRVYHQLRSRRKKLMGEKK